MPENIILPAIRININAETYPIIEILEQCSNPIKAVNATGKITINKDSYHNKNGLFPAIQRKMTNFTGQQWGGTTAQFDACELQLDRHAVLLRDNYIARLIQSLEESGVYATDTEIDEISHPFALLYHIMIRFVSYALSRNNEEDNRRKYLDFLRDFLKAINSKKLLEQKTFIGFGSPILSPLGFFIANEHGTWIISLENAIKAVSLMTANQTALNGLANHMQGLETFLKARLIAHLLPKLSVEEFSLERLGTNLEKSATHVLKLCQATKQESDPSKKISKDIVVKNSKRAVDILLNLDSRYTSSEITETIERNYPDYAEPILKIIQIYKHNHEVKQLISSLDSLNTISGWVWIMLGIVNIDAIKNIVIDHTASVCEALTVPTNSSFLRTSSGKALLTKQWTDTSTLQSGAYSSISHLQVLQDDFTLRYIYEILKNSIEQLRIIGKRLNYTVINEDRLRAAINKDILPNNTITCGQQLYYQGVANSRLALPDTRKSELVHTQSMQPISKPAEQMVWILPEDEILKCNFEEIVKQFFGTNYAFLPAQNQQLLLKQLYSIIKGYILQSIGMEIQQLVAQYHKDSLISSSYLWPKSDSSIFWQAVSPFILQTDASKAEFVLNSTHMRCRAAEELQILNLKDVEEALNKLHLIKNSDQILQKIDLPDKLTQEGINNLIQRNKSNIITTLKMQEAFIHLPDIAIPKEFKLPKAKKENRFKLLSSRLANKALEIMWGETELRPKAAEHCLPFLEEEAAEILKAKIIEAFDSLQGDYKRVFPATLKKVEEQLKTPSALSPALCRAYQNFADKFSGFDVLQGEDCFKAYLEQQNYSQLLNLIVSYIYMQIAIYNKVAEGQAINSMPPNLGPLPELLQQQGIIIVLEKTDINIPDAHFDFSENLLAEFVAKNNKKIFTTSCIMQKIHSKVDEEYLQTGMQVDNRAFVSLAKVVIDWAANYQTENGIFPSYLGHFSFYNFLPQEKRNLPGFREWLVSEKNEKEKIELVAKSLQKRAASWIFIQDETRYYQLYKDFYLSKLETAFSYFLQGKKSSSHYLLSFPFILDAFISIKNTKQVDRDYGIFTQIINALDHFLINLPNKNKEHAFSNLKITINSIVQQDTDLRESSESFKQAIWNKWILPLEKIDSSEIKETVEKYKTEMFYKHALSNWWETQGKNLYKEVATEQEKAEINLAKQWGQDLELDAALYDLPITLTICQEENLPTLRGFGSISSDKFTKIVAKWLIDLNIISPLCISENPQKLYPQGFRINQPIEIVLRILKQNEHTAPTATSPKEIMEYFQSIARHHNYYLSYDSKKYEYCGLTPPKSTNITKIKELDDVISKTLQQYLSQFKSPEKRKSASAFQSVNLQPKYSLGSVITYCLGGKGAWRSKASKVQSLKAMFADILANKASSSLYEKKWNKTNFRLIAKEVIFEELGFKNKMQKYNKLKKYIDKIIDKAFNLAEHYLEKEHDLHNNQAMAKSRDIIDGLINCTLDGKLISQHLEQGAKEEDIINFLRELYEQEAQLKKSMQQSSCLLYSSIFRTRAGFFAKQLPHSAQILNPQLIQEDKLTKCLKLL